MTPPNRTNIQLGQAPAAGSVPVVMASDQSPIPVNAVAAIGALTDHSGTIATGGVAQAVVVANAARKYLFFENVSDTDMWINFTATAVAAQPSILIKANGGSYIMESAFVSNEAVSVMCATTGKAFVYKEA